MRVTIRQLSFRLFFVVVSICAVQQVLAFDYQVGASLGIGGLGISKEADVDLGTGENTTTQVNRANRPATIGIFAEYKIDPIWMVNLEHMRGLSLGPISSGVHFTGVNGRYYFLGEPPSRVSGAARGETVLRVKNLSFFGGLGVGVASGTLTKPTDLVPEVSSSGLFVLGRAGADYPLADFFGLRGEMSYGRTLFKGSPNPAVLLLFSAHVSVYWML